MRQVVKLIKIANKAELVSFYNSILSYKIGQAQKIPSLDEFESLASNDSKQESSGFDKQTDEFLEAQALKTLEERRKNV